MRAIVNGQLVEIDDDQATIGELKKRCASVGNESLARVSGMKAEMKSDTDPVEPGAKYRSIPPVKQG